jgi:hypothetical protein
MGVAETNGRNSDDGSYVKTALKDRKIARKSQTSPQLKGLPARGVPPQNLLPETAMVARMQFTIGNVVAVGESVFNHPCAGGKPRRPIL